MKRIIGIVVISVGLLIGSCSSDSGEKRILGKWRIISDNELITFDAMEFTDSVVNSYRSGDFINHRMAYKDFNVWDEDSIYFVRRRGEKVFGTYKFKGDTLTINVNDNTTRLFKMKDYRTNIKSL